MYVKVQIKNKKLIFKWLIYVVCKDKKLIYFIVSALYLKEYITILKKSLMQ